ncbi:MAG TPA: hypothetical protein DHW82_09690 [Spirochaetia bacterium]|nr:MAG: hypothetical protein A2Y41_00470 [Spirochaetes bacterium GWB1_36_13]HCL57263.1 hypothetical protein [Spirochaetia bacterium]
MKKISEKRKSSIIATCTEDQKDEFLRLAGTENMTMSDFIIASIENRKKLKTLASLYTAGNIEVLLYQVSEFFKTAFRK